jgi:hypothetical protein
LRPVGITIEATMTASTSRILFIVAAGFAAVWALLVATSFIAGAAGVHGFRGPEQYYASLSIVPVALAGIAAITTYGLRSHFGLASLSLMTGSVVWSLGDLYYTWHQTCVDWPIFACAHQSPPPYPSFADFGYLFGPACWGIAAILLWRAAGVRRADVVGMWWIPVVSAAIGAWLVLPTFARPLGIRLGADLLVGDDYSTTQAVITIVYIVLDVLILTAAAILWRRSMEFLPFRISVLASVLLYAGDITYNARLASGTYQPAGDIADALYAASIAALIVMLHLLAGVGRHERGRRRALLERAAAHAKQHALDSSA